METRPCDYCFSLQDGSVFADFNTDKNQCLYLIRISFDGYGCCEVNSNRKKINKEQSQLLIKEFRSFRSSIILMDYFNKISDLLWKDALLENQLI